MIIIVIMEIVKTHFSIFIEDVSQFTLFTEYRTLKYLPFPRIKELSNKNYHKDHRDHGECHDAEQLLLIIVEDVDQLTLFTEYKKRSAISQN
jgi:hypothetical protein